MSKQRINMVGGGFQHDICSSAGSTPKKIEWIKSVYDAPISIHIDYSIMNDRPDRSKLNYAWLSESKTINNSLYDWCKNNIEYLESNFELIFTHDESLVILSDKIKLVICNARPWVKDYGIHQKSKMLSMIASTKTYCKEHIHRQDIVRKYRDKLDLFGNGYNTISHKEIGLKDYHFSITMENHTYPLAYSEKIADCFATGTIPIYYGTDRIGEIFDSNGIIMLDDNFNIEDLNVDLYQSKMNSIINNFEIIMNHPIAEDYIYEKYIK